MDYYYLDDKPSSKKQADDLVANFERQCELAAQALIDADVLLLVTGAGFSADSGLAVYGDVAKINAYQELNLEYSDICQPHFIGEDPELFYGFWGQSLNDYRKTKPHIGYDIIARWRDDKNCKEGIVDDIRRRIETAMTSRTSGCRDPPLAYDDYHPYLVPQHLTPYEVSDGPAGAFFSFTSNVDAHFYDTFFPYEINECHGNIELWQCSSRDCPSGIWRAPLEHKFEVDMSTMRAPSKKCQRDDSCGTLQKTISNENTGDDGVPHIGHTKGCGERKDMLKNMPKGTDTKGWYLDEESDDNWPRCGHCMSLSRPAILMFGDVDWKDDSSQERRWDLWKDAVLESNAKVCIMEIGCGLNVATCRYTSEYIVSDLLETNHSVKLVRINPDFPLTKDDKVAEHMIPIMSKGLQAVKKVDEIYRVLQETID